MAPRTLAHRRLLFLLAGSLALVIVLAAPGLAHSVDISDADGDGLHDIADNCPDLSNASQANSDGDSQGAEITFRCGGSRAARQLRSMTATPDGEIGPDELSQTQGAVTTL